MNERIQKLKHLASVWCDENIPEQFSEETGYGEAWEDKFAELIILDAKCWIHNRVGPKTALDFLEHFGVEE